MANMADKGDAPKPALGLANRGEVVTELSWVTAPKRRPTLPLTAV
jgi:hypothetical protein